jgi:hypothetical protein
MRCAAHVINLIVKDSLQNISETIIKLRDSVQYSKSTPSRKQSFQDAIKSARMKQQALPSINVPKRWNSTYQMLKFVLPFKTAFDNLATNNANFMTCPTEEDWEEITAMQEFLAIFHTDFSFLIYLIICVEFSKTSARSLTLPQQFDENKTINHLGLDFSDC